MRAIHHGTVRDDSECPLPSVFQLALSTLPSTFTLDLAFFHAIRMLTNTPLQIKIGVKKGGSEERVGEWGSRSAEVARRARRAPGWVSLYSLLFLVSVGGARGAGICEQLDKFNLVKTLFHCSIYESGTVPVVWNSRCATHSTETPNLSIWRSSGNMLTPLFEFNGSTVVLWSVLRSRNRCTGFRPSSLQPNTLAVAQKCTTYHSHPDHHPHPTHPTPDTHASTQTESIHRSIPDGPNPRRPQTHLHSPDTLELYITHSMPERTPWRVVERTDEGSALTQGWSWALGSS
ncbi:hypothetical protein DFP72DRAFT_1048492 [Ephemerocybe angulata]|uniref:Uncharacterized protein n=1 Tax=Ephemerocybe angulata TaxID=980116 RepID=A0A8H6HPE8_9AGAR|nr:hypothetical protein DFP72DRAFT_1048492 [Tulosesus angulatus]